MKNVKQNGVALVVVLMVLVVMMLTTVGILRSSNTALGIVGNLSFKQSATSVADVGTEIARNWLISPAAAPLLNADDASKGYFSNWEPADWNPLTFDWEANSVLAANADTVTGNEVRYVIHRMCALSGPTDDPTQQCVSTNSSVANGSKQLGGQGNVQNPALNAVFRVTVRVSGPRNTVAYSQVNVF